MRKWLIRTVIVLGTVVGTAFIGAVAAHPAGATTVSDCRTVTTHLAGRPDHGHGSPDVWAVDTITRTLTVCHLPAPPAPQPAPGEKSVQIDTWTYNAVLKDTGTFLTQAGAHGSPNAGAALTGGVPGVLVGEAAFGKFTAPHDWIGWDDTINGKTYQGTAPTSTGDWVKLVWKDGFSGASIDTYRWAYQTCVQKITIKGYVEQWVDASNNDDGQADSAGDITGKVCPSPSPSVSASRTPTGAAVPTTGATPSLPVTGTAVPIVAGVGAALLVAGVVVLLVARRRRGRVEFTAS